MVCGTPWRVSGSAPHLPFREGSDGLWPERRRLDSARRESTREDAPACLSIERVFREHSPYVARLCARILGRESDVDDAVQDVFVEAWRGLGAVRDENALRGWLATIAVRVSSKRLRRQRAWAWFLRRKDEHHEVPATGASPETLATLRALYKHLAALTVDERVAWTLRHMEQASLDEIAEQTGRSLATTKRRIARAEAYLTKVLGPDRSEAKGKTSHE